MILIGNLIWVILGGLIAALLWFVTGMLACLTIIGIPFGFQCFKIAGFVLMPFGREIEAGRFGLGGFLGNLIWILLCGWELFIIHMVFALIYSITIIGIPFGRQHYKLAILSLVPFGARINTRRWV